MATEVRIVAGSDVFFAHDTQGLTTGFMVPMIYERGAYVEWPSYIAAAKKAGWTFDNTMKTIQNAMLEGGRPEDWVRYIVLRCAVHWNELDE